MTYSCCTFDYIKLHSGIFDVHGGFCSSSMQTDSVSAVTVVSPSLLPTRPLNTPAFILVCEFYDGKTDSLSLFKDFFSGFTSVHNTSEMEGSRSANPWQAAFFFFWYFLSAYFARSWDSVQLLKHLRLTGGPITSSQQILPALHWTPIGMWGRAGGSHVTTAPVVSCCVE